MDYLAFLPEVLDLLRGLTFVKQFEELVLSAGWSRSRLFGSVMCLRSYLSTCANFRQKTSLTGFFTLCLSVKVNLFRVIHVSLDYIKLFFSFFELEFRFAYFESSTYNSLIIYRRGIKYGVKFT